MPAFGNVTVNDGESTPVVHTFSPVKIGGDIATYADRSGGVPTGYITFTASNRDPVAGSALNRERFVLTLPVVADGSDPSVPAGTILRSLSCDLTVLLPASSTLQERKNVWAMFKNWAASSVMTSIVQDLEHVY